MENKLKQQGKVFILPGTKKCQKKSKELIHKTSTRSPFVFNRKNKT